MNRFLIACLWLLVAFSGSLHAQTVVYIHTDALGSVVAETDANRNVLERREYEPYGQQLAPAVKNGPGYTGHVQDAGTGLVYMQQRYYDPVIGTFLSVDPVVALSNPGVQFNRYRYANSNPYRFSDPDGRLACDCQSLTPGEPQYFDGGYVPYPEIDPIDQRLVADVQIAGFEFLVSVTPYVGMIYGLTQGDEMAALEAAEFTAGKRIENAARGANKAEISKLQTRQQRALLGRTGKQNLRVLTLDRRFKRDLVRVGRGVAGKILMIGGAYSAYKTWKSKVDIAVRRQTEEKEKQRARL